MYRQCISTLYIFITLSGEIILKLFCLHSLSKIFAGLRKNSHGEGTLALPGGHLEMYV